MTFLPQIDGPAQSVAFYPTARSPEYEFRGDGPLEFCDASGEVVAEVLVPREIRRALLLLTPAKGDTDFAGRRYQVAVLEDSAVRHGPGGLAIVNLSGLVLDGMVNAIRVTLHAGLNPTLRVGESAKIELKSRLNNRSYQSFSEIVDLGQTKRALLILFPPFYRGSLEVQGRMLVDEAPVEETPRKQSR